MNDTATPSQNLLLAITRSPQNGKRKIALWIAVSVIALLLAGWLLFPESSGENNAGYVTETVAQGDLAVTVSATGNLYPTNQVDVGSELSGIVEAVLVDENDKVKHGQVLVRLDLSKLNDQVLKSQAAVLAAAAQVAQMQATVKESRATLGRLRQVAELSGGKVPSPSELEGAEAAVSRAEANEANARAAAAQASATLRSDQTNLSKASIRSPIDGIVLTRKIEPGQTVAASLQAPVLFTLAEDLARMKLQVAVDEADVSQVKTGQTAYFTVDAWPGRRYPAEIERVGFGAQTTDGVVTYKTILDVTNTDLSLRPGMTATAEISTAKRSDALLVPNAALRFTPMTATSAPAGDFVSTLMPRRPAQPKQARDGASAASPTRRIWILQDNQPAPVAITIGVSDGRYTEVVSGDLKPGMAIITGMQKPKK
ncbi:MAG: efflux RND transporter periplasmic adaptor subunit [Sideroxyarcus sp.]|nr:efflux RND transporter periplasmic adaptor subunit [Sideroxyarcus sp.]